MDLAPAQPPPHRPNFEELRDRLHRSTWSVRDEGDKVLERLCRTNLVLARLALFTDHVRMANSEAHQRPEHYRNIQPDLSNYANAMDDYKRITGSSTVDFAVHLEVCDHDLHEAAVQTVAIEQYRKELGDAARDQVEVVYLSELELMKDDSIGGLERSLQDAILRSAENEERWNTRRKTSEVIKKEQKRLLWKISVAVFGGLALIVPMLIMVLHPKLITVTITTSVSVLIVSVLLAAVMRDAEPKDVVAATAAYAAVLVVFVGGSGGGTSNGSGNQSSMSNGKLGGIIAGSIVGTLLLMIALFVLWILIASGVPGMAIPIPGVETPRNDKDGKPALSIYQSIKQERAKVQRENKHTEEA